MVKKNNSAILVLTLLFLTLIISTSGFIKSPESKFEPLPLSTSVDNKTFIDVNNILMFVTNHGSFGRDLGGSFGYDYGTWYPYTGNIDDYTNHTIFGDYSPLYSSGLWIGGMVNNTVRVTVSEYSSEYVPGPMENNTFMPDRPEFRVFKLYIDSLKINPNQDYLDYMNYGVAQGAPTIVDIDGDEVPLMRGEQMLWSVFNDANPSGHTNMGSDPLGLEIQQTVWSTNDVMVDTVPNDAQIIPIPTGSQKIFTEIIIDDALFLTGDEYELTTSSTATDGSGTWSLRNVTTNQVLVVAQLLDIDNPFSQVIDGFIIKFLFDINRVNSFEVVANGNGVVDPPISAALWSQGFPTPDSADPTSLQQVGDAIWAFHTGDNGGTSGGGTRADYNSYNERVYRGDTARMNMTSRSNWEMRFTGSNDNPGVNGGYALSAYISGKSIWVPFELWKTGLNTPDDPSDDIRLIPWIFDDQGDSLYYLSSYGSEALANCGPGAGQCEHSASDGDDDPNTDWVYWRIPSNSAGEIATTGGDSAYMVFENAAIADPTMASWGYDEQNAFDRTVLISLNARVQPPFNQETPEQGTIFRIKSKRSIDLDTNRFVTNAVEIITVGGDANSIYNMYKITNKGTNVIDDCYISFWSDPDLGDLSDDLIGCDTLSNLWYCYNATNIDANYGPAPPAIGFKLLYGPVVESVGDSAFFGTSFINGYKNLPMTSFSHYYNGTDPDGAIEAYNYMRGKKSDGSDYIYNGDVLSYFVSGDPVTGVGDLDLISSDRRMMASSGPFTFAPSSVQYIFTKMAVGQSNNNLNSITHLKNILNLPFEPFINENGCCVGYRGNIDNSPDDGTLNSVDISDLVFLVSYVFTGGEAPVCTEEANIDGDLNETIDISDVVFLVDLIFRTGTQPSLCP